ncbi:hypothetical protein WN51_13989 [Melipona quadrifasciata]|uniref:Uncharacterized protein n=1 Tax=Melipona quadrifasciata TaxID=166423 RepID=A0A0N0BFV8_9HYME|nr:hypothetical protein WN51_13989 [Melipona quadrifasciata]
MTTSSYWETVSCSQQYCDEDAVKLGFRLLREVVILVKPVEKNFLPERLKQYRPEGGVPQENTSKASVVALLSIKFGLLVRKLHSHTCENDIRNFEVTLHALSLHSLIYISHITRIVASGAQNALARIERLAEGVMEFRELKNDHASLKHPSPARPVQASSIGHVLLKIFVKVKTPTTSNRVRDPILYTYIKALPYIHSADNLSALAPKKQFRAASSTDWEHAPVNANNAIRRARVNTCSENRATDDYTEDRQTRPCPGWKMESGAHQGNAAGIILKLSTFPMPRAGSSGTALGKGRASASLLERRRYVYAVFLSNDRFYLRANKVLQPSGIPQLRVSNTDWLAQAASGCALSVEVLPIFDVKESSVRNLARMGASPKRNLKEARTERERFSAVQFQILRKRSREKKNVDKRQFTKRVILEKRFKNYLNEFARIQIPVIWIRKAQKMMDIQDKISSRSKLRRRIFNIVESWTLICFRRLTSFERNLGHKRRLTDDKEGFGIFLGLIGPVSKKRTLRLNNGELGNYTKLIEFDQVVNAPEIRFLKSITVLSNFQYRNAKLITKPKSFYYISQLYGKILSTFYDITMNLSAQINLIKNMRKTTFSFTDIIVVEEEINPRLSKILLYGKYTNSVINGTVRDTEKENETQQLEGPLKKKSRHRVARRAIVNNYPHYEPEQHHQS